MNKYIAGIALAAIVYGCNPSTINNTNTNLSSRITSLDLKSQNIEYIRSNIEKILGADSSGQVALTYIKNYEEELNDNLSSMPQPEIYQEQRIVWTQGIAYSGYRTLSPDPKSTFLNKNSVFQNKLQIFLKSKQSSAQILLNDSYNKFESSKNVSYAKLGVAAGYVSLASGSSGINAENISKKMNDLILILNK